MRSEFTGSQAKTQAQKDLMLEAKAEWRAACEGVGEPKEAFGRIRARYPSYKPDLFRDGGSKKRAYDLLRGPVGRLRMLTEEPLESSFATLGALGLAEWESDAEVLFDSDAQKKVSEAVGKHVDGPHVGFIERGKHGRVHVHVLAAQGASRLGARKKVPDSGLLRATRYLAKPPPWDEETAAAYLTVKRAYGRVGSARSFSRDLGNARTKAFELPSLETLLGITLTKPTPSKAAETVPEHAALKVKLPPMPLLGGARDEVIASTRAPRSPLWVAIELKVCPYPPLRKEGRGSF